MNFLTSFWPSIWTNPDHGFATGKFSEMPASRLLMLSKEDRTIDDLIEEIDARNVPSIDKAIEFLLKSIEVWNQSNSENLEDAMRLATRAVELLMTIDGDVTEKANNLENDIKIQIDESFESNPCIEPPPTYNKDDRDLWAGLCACIVPWKERKSETFDSIVGHDKVKKMLQSTIIASFERDSRCREPDTVSYRGGTGIVFVGPPGTGKTSLAYAACNSIPNATLLSVDTSFLSSKYHGDSTKLCRMLFTLAKRCKPSMIFFDEMEDLCGTRNDKQDNHTSAMKGVLLTEMQRLKNQKQVYLLGATNRVDAMDSGFVRRFEYFIYVGYANEEELFQLLKQENSLYLSSVREKELKSIASRLRGAPQSYVTILVRKCADRAEHKLLDGQSFFRPSTSLELMPCPQGFPGSISIPMCQVPNNLRIAPPIIYEDYLECLESVGMTFKESTYDLQRYIDWNNSLGTAGLICELFPDASN